MPMSLLNLLPLIGLSLDPSTAMPPPPKVALVIGSNAALHEGSAALRFADDDAAKMTLLLEELGFSVTLLTRFDQDSQALFPELVKRAHVPNGRAVEQAFARAHMLAPDAEFVFFYSGHGEVDTDGQSYLTLEDGKLTRQALFATYLKAMPDVHKHIIIDACRSEQFVLAKGAWKPDAVRGSQVAVARALREQQFSALPRAGVLFAHSLDQQTHEWDRYQGGVFTHEVVSALRGGADLNGDGALEYSEVAAFVASANSAVTDPRARLTITVLPPAEDERHPLVTQPGLGTARVLLIDDQQPHHYVIESAQGVRVADVHRGGPAYVRLPPGEVHVGRTDDQPPTQAQVDANAHGSVRVSDLTFRPQSSAPRGSLDGALRAGLFSRAFSPGYYTGFSDSVGLLQVSDPSWRVEVWRRSEDGEERVTTVVVDDPPKPKKPRVKEAIEDAFGGVSVGLVLTPLSPSGEVPVTQKRTTANEFETCVNPFVGSGCGSPVRGSDFRFTFYTMDRDDKYPFWQVYFRTGHTVGRTRFSQPDGTAQPANATELAYLTVPLFFGTSFTPFTNFPVRPYGGLGFGFDIMALKYTRAQRSKLSDVSLRIGFELHAGIEARLGRRFYLIAEVMQLWSARRRLPGVPDLSNESFTVMTGAGVTFGLPSHRKPRRQPHAPQSTPGHRVKVVVDAKPEPPKPPVAPTAPVPPEAAPTANTPTQTLHATPP